MKEVLQFLRENPTFYIATADGDQPRVRPFGALTDYDGKIYLVTSNTKNVYAQLKKNPKFELTVTSASGTEWIRIEAKAEFDSRREIKVKMLEENSNLEGLYTPDDGIMEVFYMKDAAATFYSFTAEPKTVTF